MARRKTPLALLPGLILDDALWAHQTEHLADLAEMRVADFTTQDSVPEMARSVLEMMPEETFALAGLSMGGYVALEVMRQAPERVERLALLDTRAAPDGPDEIERRRALVKMSRVGKFKGVTERLLPLFIHEDRLDDRLLVDAIQAMSKRVGRDAFGRQQHALLTRVDARPLLGRIEVPTLVLCGRQDRLTPLAHHEAMAGEIPNAELVVIEDCGHLAPMERPEETTAAMRSWLEGKIPG